MNKKIFGPSPLLLIFFSFLPFCGIFVILLHVWMVPRHMKKKIFGPSPLLIIFFLFFLFVVFLSFFFILGGAQTYE